MPRKTASGPSRDLEWNDVGVILAICRAGSLGGAARALGITHSTIFRRLNVIEEKCAVRFFNRLPNGYVMTEAGEAAMQYGERIEGEMQSLGREVLGRDMLLQGKIRVTAPEGISSTLLPGIFADFINKHPDVSIDLIVSSLSLNLSQREADIALRVTNNPPDASLGRKVCGFGNDIYASRSYLKLHKNTPLNEQSWIIGTGASEWIVSKVWKSWAKAETQIVMSSNSLTAVIGAARAGMGVVTLPSFLGDLDSDLVRVPHNLGAMKSELWLLTHPDLRHTARVRALMAHMHEALVKRRELFEGLSIA